MDKQEVINILTDTRTVLDTLKTVVDVISENGEMYDHDQLLAFVDVIKSNVAIAQDSLDGNIIALVRS